jgi:rod shape-determining protein MreD
MNVLSLLITIIALSLVQLFNFYSCGEMGGNVLLAFALTSGLLCGAERVRFLFWVAGLFADILFSHTIGMYAFIFLLLAEAVLFCRNRFDTRRIFVKAYVIFCIAGIFNILIFTISFVKNINASPDFATLIISTCVTTVLAIPVNILTKKSGAIKVEGQSRISFLSGMKNV